MKHVATVDDSDGFLVRWDVADGSQQVRLIFPRYHEVTLLSYRSLQGRGSNWVEPYEVLDPRRFGKHPTTLEQAVEYAERFAGVRR